MHPESLPFHADQFTAHNGLNRPILKVIGPVVEVKTHLCFETLRRQDSALRVPIAFENGAEDAFQERLNRRDVCPRQSALRATVGVVAQIRNSRIVH